MTVQDIYEIAKQVDEQLEFLALSKMNMSCEEVEETLRNMEREEYKEKFIKGKCCNLTTCRYNQSGDCTNEDKRKECVEVSKRVLCLEVENEVVLQKEKE